MIRNNRPHDPDAATLTGLHKRRFRLFRFRSPLLAESQLLSFPAGTEMFHFPAFASQGLYIQPRDDTALPVPGFPIRKSPGQSLLTAHRGLSQLATSFIAFRCQGIHHVPFPAWPQTHSPRAEARDAISVFKQEARDKELKARTQFKHFGLKCHRVVTLSIQLSKSRAA